MKAGTSLPTASIDPCPVFIAPLSRSSRLQRAESKLTCRVRGAGPPAGLGTDKVIESWLGSPAGDQRGSSVRSPSLCESQNPGVAPRHLRVVPVLAVGVRAPSARLWGCAVARIA